MKMEFDITKMVEEIAMQAKKNQEEFVFETIQPYCENILQMKINKEELKQILLNGIKKQQTSEDCISRKAVNVLIDELARAISDERCFVSRGRATSTIMQDILDLPSITPKAEWIPISEKLPESAGVYIVTREFTDGIECADLTDACYFDGTSTWHNDNRTNHGREYVDKKIKAWMPLPHPYKISAQTFGCAED